MRNIVVASLIIFTIALPALAENQRYGISIDEAVRSAVSNNFDIALNRLAVERAKQRVIGATAIYDPALDAAAWLSQTRSAATSAFADPDVQKTSSGDFSIGVSGELFTGAEYNVEFETDELETNSTYASLDPQYGTALNFDLSQPLLKGAGRQVTEWKIITGLKDQSIAQKNLAARISQVITETQEAYWNLVYQKGKLMAEKESLSLAKNLMRRVQVQVSAGAMAPIETIQAKASVAEREGLVIEAENQLAKSEDELLTLINPDLGGAFWSKRLDPISEPATDFGAIDLDESVGMALTKRPEIVAAIAEIEKRGIELVYYKNQTKPSIDLFATLSLNGVRGEANDSIDFSSGETTTTPYSGQWGDALSDTFSGGYYDYAVGLKFSMPFSTRAAKAAAAEARFSIEEATVKLKKIERDITMEVRNAVRDIFSGQKQIDAAKAARKLAEERMAAELVKFEAGASTSFTVLEYQKDLIVQKSNELSAVASVRRAIARYYQAVGSALEASGLTVQ